MFVWFKAYVMNTKRPILIRSTVIQNKLPLIYIRFFCFLQGCIISDRKNQL